MFKSSEDSVVESSLLCYISSGDYMKKLMFDCDDTLYDLSWPFRKCMEEFLPNVDVDMDLFYADYRKFGDLIFDQLQQGKITIDESGVYRIEKACEKYGIELSHESAVEFQSRYKYYQHHIEMDGPLIDYFSNCEDELAILTNGEDAHQRMKLEVLHVFDYFNPENVFTSGQIGVAKPDVKAFKKCMDAMQEDITEWYYVGDNYINDMQGAKSAGMKTIHFNRHHQASGPCADHVVYSAEELVELIKKD